MKPMSRNAWRYLGPVLLATTLAAPASAAPEQALARQLGNWIAQQGNQALQELKQELRDELRKHLAPPAPIPAPPRETAPPPARRTH